MAKVRQLAFRIDEDLGQEIAEAAAKFKQSQANIVAAALHLFATQDARRQRAAVLAYLTRAVPGEESRPAPARTTTTTRRPSR